MRLVDGLQVATWLSVAAVIALFLSDGTATAFDSPAEGFTTLGVLAGLVATDLLLIMLVLAARLPVIDRAIGHDRAMARHQQLGKPVLYLLLGHAVLLTTGYALSSRVNVFVEAWDMFTTLPDIPLAFLGLALFLAVVITSLVIVRRRFRYETWYLVHLLAYAAVAVAIPHQFSVGGIFVVGSLQWAVWVLAYVAVGGALLYFRFVVPLVRSTRHGLRVSRIVAVAPGVVSIELVGRRLEELPAHAGQFLIWRFWQGGLWWHSHPFSLSAAPHSQGLRITVRDLGDGTARLGELRAGTRVSIEGPYGLFTEMARTSNRLVLVAAGIGIAPIRALLERARFAPGEATVLLRGATDAHVFLLNEVAELCRLRGATLHVLTGSRPDGRTTWLPASAAAQGLSLRALVPDLAESDVYVCGPRSWSDLVVRDARRGGVPAHQIHYERFDW